MIARIGDEPIKVKYFIGDEDGDGGIGIYYGSNNIDDVLKEIGKSLNSGIYEDNIIYGTKLIYRWTGERWRKI